MKKLIIGAAFIALVVTGVLFMVLGAERSDERDTPQDSQLPTSQSASNSTSPSQAASQFEEPNGVSSDDLEESISGQGSAGPFLVSSDAIVDIALPAHQKRVFRAPDDTIAVLYHRVDPKSPMLNEIVLTHSHDGGRTWQGEITIGTEVAKATYSGIADADGNIFVAYGSHAPGSAGGAITVRKLTFVEEFHAWTLGPARKALLDWPGRGASFPVLAFSGTRLWLAYRYYDGKGYFINVQFADPDRSFDYPDSSWSIPFPVSPVLANQGLYAVLVPHDSRLSVFYPQEKLGDRKEQTGIIWRILNDPQGQPNEWKEEVELFRTRVQGQNTALSAIADEFGNIHLTAGKQGLFSAYLRYDGFDWSNPTQLAVSNVFSVSLVGDGDEVWAFWNKVDSTGFSRIIARKWQPDIGWAGVAESPWQERFGEELQSVIWYRSNGGSFADITRYGTASGGSGPETVVSKFLRRSEDAIYVRDDSKFSNVPFKLVTRETTDSVISFEYWNGSQWSPIVMASELINGIGAFQLSDVGFDPPQDWQPTQVNGDSGFFVRLRRSGLKTTVSDLLRVSSTQQVFGPLANSSIPGVVDVVWSEFNQDSDRGRLWYGVVSTDGTFPTAGNIAQEHKVEPPFLLGVLSPPDKPSPLPPGSPRQYTSVSLDVEESLVYQLLDGQIRYIKVLETELVEQSRKGVTIWATATVEVAGPGLEPAVAVIPAAYFQTPVVLNDVRVYVEITREFNDGQLIEGGATSGLARLQLSDSRYSLTDLTQYSYPFAGTIWGLGASSSYYQGLLGTDSSLNHGAFFRQGMPSGLDFYSWHKGILQLGLRNGWQISLNEGADGLSRDWHFATPIEPIDTDRIGTLVESGEKVGTVGGPGNVVSIKWGKEGSYDWAPVLAEWYVANASPVERSYVKDWLVLGPFDSPTKSRFLTPSNEAEDFVSPLDIEFLPQEATVRPAAGDQVGDSLNWKRYDGIVPGIINVAEAVSDFPNSGWAKINGNYADSVAYFATYIHSPSFQEAVLNIGSSDGIKVWLGDELILDKNTFVRVNRKDDWSIVPDVYRQTVRLQPGWNKVLIKLSQGKTDYRGIRAPQNAWQLSFRVSSQDGQPIRSIKTSPERDLSADPLARFAIPKASPEFAERARPPKRIQEWPEEAHLQVGEEYIYSLRDGSERTVKLLSYEVVIPRHKIQATVQVRSDDKVETHTLNVAMAAVPVSINGVRVYGFVWQDARQYGYEDGDENFPLDQGKDIALVLSDASFGMFPDIDSYVHPFEAAFHENVETQSFLEPAGPGSSPQLPGHSGYDLHAPPDAALLAIHDGTVWYKEAQVMLSTTTGDKGDPVRWFWTHVPDPFGSATVPNGTFVEKGTPIALGGSHMSTPGNFDFGSFVFASEVWNNQHKNDFPTPRQWLVLGPYEGSIDANFLVSNESRDLPTTVLPAEGSPDYRNNLNWKFGDNLVNSVVNIGELLSISPFSGLDDREHLDAVAYAATYIYSPEGHTADGKVWLKWGASFGSKVWLNGKTVIDNTASLEGHRYNTYTDGRPLIIDEFAAVLPLKQGWNTLIIKVNQGSRNATKKAWRFSAKIGDQDGNNIPGLRFSTRNIKLRAQTIEDDSISISWDRPIYHGTNVTSYKLDVATDAAFTDLLVDNLDIGDVTTYTISNLIPASTYFIRLKPYNDWELGGSVYWQYFDVIEVAEQTSDLNDTPDILAPSVFRRADPAVDGWLRAEGNRIVGSDQTPVMLRGVNLENREWLWADERTIEFERVALPIAVGAPPNGWGANLITLAIASGPVNRDEKTYLKFLDELIEISRDNGAYTVLTYRSAEPNDDQPRMPDDAAQRAMARLAERYSNEPSVIYSLQAEPHDVSWGVLKPRFTSMVDAIRDRNNRALIAIPGTDWGRDIGHALGSPINRSNLIYKTHPYDDWSTIQARYGLEELSKKLPILIGEFGEGPLMDIDDVENLLSFAERQGISWSGWLFHDLACPCMLDDSNNFSTTEYGEAVKKRLQFAATFN